MPILPPPTDTRQAPGPKHADVQPNRLNLALRLVELHTRRGNLAVLRRMHRHHIAWATWDATTGNHTTATESRIIAAEALAAIHYLETSKRADA